MFEGQRKVVDGEDIIINRTIVAGEDNHYLFCKFGCVGSEQNHITQVHKLAGLAEDVLTSVKGNLEVITIVDRQIAIFSKS